MDEAGIELPDPTSHDTSMDTIADWANQFYVENERYGLAISFRELFVTVLCRAYNTFFINEEGTECLIMDDENAQEGLRWAYNLAVEDKVLPAPGEIQGGFNSAQLEGMLTMQWSGSLTVRNFKRDIEDEEVAQTARDNRPPAVAPQSEHDLTFLRRGHFAGVGDQKHAGRNAACKGLSETDGNAESGYRPLPGSEQARADKEARDGGGQPFESSTHASLPFTPK
mgnify:CR=1 FL=1